MHDALSRSCGGEFVRFAAPILRPVVISDRYGLVHSAPVEALLDTGADMSAIPQRVAEKLRMEPIDFRIPGVATRVREVQRPLYVIRVSSPGFELNGLRVWGFDRSSVVLGRDFMQRLGLVLVCDFGAGRFSLTKGASWKSRLLRALGF